VQKQERRLRVGCRGAALDGLLQGAYFLILYARSPAAFFDDSTLLPWMLTKPRTVVLLDRVAVVTIHPRIGRNTKQIFKD
jgi:hypothetical protein